MLNACEGLDAQSSTSSPMLPTTKTSTEQIVGIIAATVGGVSLCIMVAICWFMRKPVHVLVPFEDHHKPVASDLYFSPKEDFRFQDLVDATNNFSESAVIGRGACGTVYKATMPSGEFIAVKKLASNREGSNMENSFNTEISTLGKIRHRNIVKLYGFCYHQESNLLLYEYMPNGSLGEILHGNSCILDWDTRYKIALGAAEGLSYLHSDCKPHIVHRDIKSNNILLDENFEAHVGDFGLAKVIDMPQSKSMSAVAGSYGYIAPEYAYTMRVTEKCDTYSFGVVLLELLTGQPPVQPLDQGGDLVTWVKRSIKSTSLTSGVLDNRVDLTKRRTVEEMSLVLKIALFCTNTSPFDRPTMREVVKMLLDVREKSASVLSSPTSETPLDHDIT